MSLQEEIKQLSYLYGVKPSRNRGQNFLIEEKIYDDIVSAAKIQKDEIVLEVGPGLGFLTERLARVAKKVIAVELDTKLFDALNNRLALGNITNVETYNDDIMNFERPWSEAVKEIPNEKLIVVANLPYTITSIFLRHFIGGNKKNILPQRLLLMLQKEVAERVTAQAGEMSILAVSVQLYAEAKIIQHVSRKYFWPQPDVDSAVLELRRSDKWLEALREGNSNDEELLRAVRIGFSARRKMLKANLSNGFCQDPSSAAQLLLNIGLSEKVRAQELGLQDWVKILSHRA